MPERPASEAIRELREQAGQQATARPASTILDRERMLAEGARRAEEDRRNAVGTPIRLRRQR